MNNNPEECNKNNIGSPSKHSEYEKQRVLIEKDQKEEDKLIRKEN